MCIDQGGTVTRVRDRQPRKEIPFPSTEQHFSLPHAILNIAVEHSDFWPTVIKTFRGKAAVA